MAQVDEYSPALTLSGTPPEIDCLICQLTARIIVSLS